MKKTKPSDEVSAAYTVAGQSEEITELLFHIDNSPLAIVEWDKDFFVTRWAGASERMFGWTAKEVLGKAITDLHLIYPEDMQVVENTMKKLTDGVSSRGVSANRNLTKEGRIIHCEWYNSVYFDESGKMTSVLSQVLDITDKVEAQKTIMDSHDRLAMALQVGNEGIWEWDQQSGNVGFDFAFHQMLGYVPGELPLTAEEWFTFHHPDDIPLMRARVDAYLNNNEPYYESEHRIRNKSGDWNWILTRGKLVQQQPNSGSHYFMGIALNINSKKEAEAELRASEEKYKSIFENVQDVFYQTDLNGVITEISPSIKYFSDFNRQDLLGGSVFDLYNDPADRHQLVEELLKNKELRDYEIKVKNKGGDIKYASINARLVFDENGTPTCINGALRDVTERMLVQEAMREKEELFSKVFQTSHYAITITAALDGKFIDVNDAFTVISGYTREEALADSAVGLKLWLEQGEREEVVRQLKSGKVIRDKECLFMTKFGNVIIGLISAQIIHIKNQPYILSSINDITDHKRAEQALHESDLQYQTLANSGTALIWQVDENMVWQFFNKPWLHFTGLTLRQAITGKWSDWVHAEDFEICSKIFDRAFAFRESFEMEYRLKNQNGEYRWVRDMGTPNFNSNGDFIGYIGHSFDVHSHKQLLESLEKKSTELEVLNQFFVGRELKMIALKKEINELLREFGREEKYTIHD
ncbi:MAG: PAS domain S-box protein [Bacteroidales bacterium]|nr:PAS domain S-box protein [Bacteroidales bacterium]